MHKISKTKRCLLLLIGVLALIFCYETLGCPIRGLTGIPCAGCGMMRAVRALLHADAAAAWQNHPLVFLLPLLAVWGILGVFGFRMPRKTEQGMLFAVAAVFAAVWLIRLCCGDPVVQPTGTSAFSQGIRWIQEGFS